MTEEKKLNDEYSVTAAHMRSLPDFEALRESTEDLFDLVEVLERKGLNEEARRLYNRLVHIESCIFSSDMDKIKLSQDLMRDALTNIYNRRYLNDALPKAIARAQRGGGSIVFAMLDIDHFKRFNDTYGHQVGDDVLCGVAQRLQGSLREGDVAARYGGEEMVVIMEFNAGDDISAALHRLESDMCAFQIEHEGQKYSIGMSIGAVAVDAKEGIIPEAKDLIKQADDLLYNVKESGRGRMLINLSDPADLPVTPKLPTPDPAA